MHKCAVSLLHYTSRFHSVFGGITACDQVASGIVGALKKLGDAATKPLVVRLDGNNVEEGRQILADFAHPLVTQADTMDGGAGSVAELRSEERRVGKECGARWEAWD